MLLITRTSLRVQGHDSRWILATCNRWVYLFSEESLTVSSWLLPPAAGQARCLRQESFWGSIREGQRPTCLCWDGCSSQGPGSWNSPGGGLGAGCAHVLWSLPCECGVDGVVCGHLHVGLLKSILSRGHSCAS